MTDIIELSGPGDLGFTVAKVQAEAAATRAEQAKDLVLPARDQTIAARDVAVAARDIATAARDEAVAARAIAQPASAAAVAARDQAVPARTEAVAARDEAVAARDLVLPARDATLAARDLVLPARDATLAAKGEAVAARDTAVAARDTATAARDVTTVARDATLTAKDIATTKATNAADSAAAAAASLAAMPAVRATQAEADAQSAIDRWVAPAVLGSRPLRVTASVTVNVAVGDSIQGAIDSLNRYVFEGAAIGKVVLAAGIHTLPSASGLYSSHPQAVSGKIWLQGAAPAAVAITDFTGDKATDQAMLRARYPTTVVCPGHGVEITSAGRGLVVDQIHLEQAAGSSQYGLYVAYTDRGLIVGNVAASGFYAGAYGSHAGRLRWRSSTDRLVAAHCQYSLSLSGAMCDVPLLSVYPTAVGASLYNGAKWTTLGDSKFAGGTYGVYLALASSVEVPISEIKGYATGGVTIQRGSAAVLTAQLSIDGPAATYIGAEASTGSVLKLTAGVSVNDANTLGKVVKASAGSDVKILASGVVGTPTYSPAPGVSGNTSSLITVY